MMLAPAWAEVGTLTNLKKDGVRRVGVERAVVEDLAGEAHGASQVGGLAEREATLEDGHQQRQRVVVSGVGVHNYTPNSLKPGPVLRNSCWRNDLRPRCSRRLHLSDALRVGDPIRHTDHRRSNDCASHQVPPRHVTHTFTSLPLT